MRFPRARGRTTRREPGQMNKLEAAYRNGVLADRVNRGEIVVVDFERITFKLADDTRYTPDFFCLMADGTIEFHEVKGFMEDDAWVKLKLVAEQHPWFAFVLVTRKKKADGGGWSFRTIGQPVSQEATT